MSTNRKAIRSERLVSVDFDGVLHEHKSYRLRFGKVETDLIRALHRAGHPVAVSTCNTLGAVAEALRGQGFKVYADYYMDNMFWDGGADGKTVLVTGRKVAAWKYIDDRNIIWEFGDPVAEAVKACRLPSGAARCLRCGAQTHWVTSLARPESRQAILEHADDCDEKEATA